MAERLRCFICIDMPEEAMKEIARIQEQLNKKLKFIGKTTELENLHLTLKFLGEINEETIKKVQEKLSAINFPPIKAKLGKIGVFSRHQPKILWAEIQGRINHLQKQVDESLKDIFPIENRFMAHMTLARIKYVKDIKYTIEYIKHLRIKPIIFEI